MWTKDDYERCLKRLMKRREKLEKKMRGIGPLMRGTITVKKKTFWSTQTESHEEVVKYISFSYHKNGKNKKLS